MLKKMLIIAGLLSVVSVSTQAEPTIITEDTVISTEIKNITTTTGNGGAILNNGYNLTINSDISSNALEGPVGQAVFGGAIFQSGGKLTINDGVTFDNNTVTSGSQTYPGWSGVDSASGGAIYITGDFKIETNGNVTFSNNKAIGNGPNDESNGGAIAVQGSSPNASMTFDNVNFSDNSSVTRGGAIYNGDTNITINGKGEFSGNTSKTGGAVYNLDTTGNTKFTTGTDSTFTSNSATGNGGAIANFDGVVNVGQNNEFSNNTAQKGGAIYNSNWQKTAVTNISGGTTFSNNEATDKGGAIYNSGSVKMDTTAGDITFTNNSSANGGSDAYLDGNSSELIVSGTNENNKVSFGSANSIAGDGKITHQSAGTFEIKDNQNLDAFTGTYKQTGGKTTLDNSTIFNKYDISAGKLELVNGSNATIDGKDKVFNGSELSIENSELDVKTKINSDVAIEIKDGGNVNVNNGGHVAIDNNDVLSQGAKITLGEKGTVDYGKSEDASAVIVGNAGNLNLLSGSTLTISNGSSIQDGVALNIQSGSKLNLEENLTLNLDSADKWNGHIYNQNGVINAKGVVNSSGSIYQEDGELNLNESSKITLNSDSKITGGNVKIEDNSVLTIDKALLSGGDVTIDENSAFIVKSTKDNAFSLDSLTAQGAINPGNPSQAALINVMNSQLDRVSITDLNIGSQANFNVDILGRSSLRNDSDKFIITNNNSNGTIRINDWKFYGDVYGYDAPIDRKVKLGDIFVDENNKPIEASIETTDTTNFSPIGWYQLNKGAGIGNYTLDLVKYNPQVYRGQVATVSQWMNQLNIDDMLFTHSMVLPSFKDENSKMSNNYASTDPLFAPYQYSRKDGGIWVKGYGVFEHLQMSNGLSHVGNNSYGTLIGADLGLKELKNGWTFMPTAYIGYNGAHQYWSNVSQYQNGGQAGFLGTWYKDNFILGAMAYGGVYGNSMDVHGNTDETFNYFAGTAAKASYNIKVHRDFVIQPNLMAAYNYFGQQNWHSDFGQMGMMAGMLHGVNVAPGVNFIWEKETFSAYLTLQYMYNVNGASGGRAGNVYLPQIKMERGYIQYGIGFTKKFTDRASGYFQAVLRNVGRTGVGFQAGFLVRLGK